MPKFLSPDEIQEIMTKYGNNAAKIISDRFINDYENANAITAAFYGTGSDYKAASQKLTNYLAMNLRQRPNTCGWAVELVTNPGLTLEDLADCTSSEAIRRKQAAGKQVLNYLENPEAFSKVFAEGCKKLSALVSEEICSMQDGFTCKNISKLSHNAMFLDGLFDAHNQVFIRDNNHPGVADTLLKPTFDEIQRNFDITKLLIQISVAGNNAIHSQTNDFANLHTSLKGIISGKAWADKIIKDRSNKIYNDIESPEYTLLNVGYLMEQAQPTLYSRDKNAKGVLSLLDDEELIGLALCDNPNLDFKVAVTPGKEPEFISRFDYSLNGIDLQVNTPVSEINPSVVEQIKNIAHKSLVEIQALNATPEDLTYDLLNTDEAITSPNGITIVDDNYVQGLFRVDTEYNSNIAMYYVAQLLGRPDMFVKSDNMTVKTRDGKEYKGAFSKIPEGYTIKPGSAEFNRFDKPETSPLNTPSGLKAIADLQMFTYITSGVLTFNLKEISFKEENGAITGMTLLNSINTGTFSSDESKNLMNPLLISESMAQRIEQLSKKVFTEKLKSTGINATVIEEAWKRVEGVKSMIANPSDKIEPGRLRIVKDSEWKDLSLEHIIAEQDQMSLFSDAYNFKNAYESKPQIDRNSVRVDRQFGRYDEIINDFEKLLKEHKDNKLFLRGSKQYDLMGTALKNAIESAKAAKMDSSPENREELRASMQYVKQSVKDYMQLHANDKSPNKKTIKRMTVAANILAFTADKTEILNEEALQDYKTASANAQAEQKKIPYHEKLEELAAFTDTLDESAKKFGRKAVESYATLVDMMKGKAYSEDNLSSEEQQLARECMANVTVYDVILHFRAASNNQKSVFEDTPEGVDPYKSKADTIMKTDSFNNVIKPDQINMKDVSNFLKNNLDRKIADNFFEEITAVHTPKADKVAAHQIVNKVHKDNELNNTDIRQSS